MRDYMGDIEVFQRKLTNAGISEAELDLDNYIGCTMAELQGLVDNAIAKKKAREEGNK